MFVLAHPDDETLGNGATIARYADEGIETHLVTATGGELGWFGDPADNPGPEELARIRAEELRKAADVLGIATVSMLGYKDGDLSSASTPEVVGKIVSHIRRVRPQVIVTFDQNGLYGHPDHIAVTQYTTAAVAASANPGYADPEGRPPHQVQKLYYMAWTAEDVREYEQPFGEFVMHINGSERRSIPWPEWSITTRIEAYDTWQRVWDAIRCHRTQLPQYEKLANLPEETHRRMWGVNAYYRALSTVDCGNGKVETDLFAGLR
jgi:LmbE family N-acetylglucosaminyl deacetylase